MPAQQSEIEMRLEATERLLTTLVAFLAVRDPQLLTELESVFAKPDFAGDRAGRSASETWSRVSAHLAQTRALVDDLKPPTSN